MSVTDALCLALCAFWWGQWVAERKATREGAPRDVAFKLLLGMVSGILEKRKFVGAAMTITREEKFTVSGERFVLSLRSDGDPSRVSEDEPC